MFGDMMGMMGKLKETRKKVEETKKRFGYRLFGRIFFRWPP